MEFAGRERELAVLEREYAQPRSTRTMLYGRRRLGKTTLCTQFAKDKGALYFLATEESEAQNRAAFQRMVADFLDDPLLANARIDDWALIFRRIAETSGSTKPVIVLDEFQYLGIANPAFPSILQRVWDTILKDANVMIILCDSLISMMESQTLNYSSPLYGRRTSQIQLKQMSLSAYGGLFPGLPERDLIPL